MLLDFQFIKCPHCGKWYLHTDLMSYSLFGRSECWSDGKCFNGQFSEYSFMPFTKCDSCQSFFWFQDCQKFPEYELRDFFEANLVKRREMKLASDFISKNPEYQMDGENNLSLNYPYPHYWDNLPEYFLKDFVSLLEQTESLNEEREIYVRTKLWQHINDFTRKLSHPFLYHFKGGVKNLFNFKSTGDYINLRRKNKRSYSDSKNLKNENLKRLIQLVESPDLFEDTLLLLTEAYRELGNFRDSKIKLKELEKITGKENKSFVKKTKRKLLLKSKAFFKI